MSTLQSPTFDPAYRLPVLDLSPDNSNSTSYLEANVALVWPYSSSSATLALLLVDTYTKPGQLRGQVKVIFRYGCARNVANTKVGIGDTVRLHLNDCAWNETGDVISTPGKKLAWDLEYTSRVRAQISRDGQDSITVDYTRSDSQEPVATPVPIPISILAPTHLSTPISTPTSNGLRRHLPGTISVPYFSPAKSTGRSSGATFLDGSLESLAGEDGYITGRGRKRTKFARQSGAWNLIDSDDDPETQTTVNHQDLARKEDIPTPKDALLALPRDSPPSPPSIQHVSLPSLSSPVHKPPPVMGPPQTPAKTLRLTPPDPPQVPSPTEDSDQTTTPRLLPLPSPGLPLVSPLIRRTGVEFGYFPTFEATVSQLDASAKDSTPLEDDLPGDKSGSAQGSPLLVQQLEQADEQQHFEPNSSPDTIAPSTHTALTTSNLNNTEPEADPYLVPDHWLSSLEANIAQELQQDDQLSPLPVVQEAQVTIDIESDDLYGPAPQLPHKSSEADHEPVLEEQIADHEEPPVGSTVPPNNGIQERQTSPVHASDSVVQSSPVLSLSGSSRPEHYSSSQPEQASKSPEPVHVITSDEDSDEDATSVESDQPVSLDSEQASQADPESDSDSEDDIEVTAVTRHNEPDYTEAESPPLASTSPKVSFIETVLTEIDERSAQVTVSHPHDHTDAHEDADNDTEPDVNAQDLHMERSRSRESTQSKSPDVVPSGSPDEPAPKSPLPEVSDFSRPQIATSILPTPDQTQDDSSPSQDHLVDTKFQPDQEILLPSPIPTQETQETAAVAKGGSDPNNLPDSSPPNLDSTVMQPLPPQKPPRSAFKPKNISSPYFTPRRSARLSSPEARRDTGSPSSPLQPTFPTSPVIASQENEVIAPSPILPTTENFPNGEKGLATPVAYYAYLASLQEHFGEVIDTIAVCSDSSKAERAKSGPKDYFLTIHVLDQSCSSPILAQIFRPVKNSLPSLNPGDAIILRNFKVQTIKGNFALLSTETSAWGVSQKSSSQLIISGPPIEHGPAEASYAASLIEWWEKGVPSEELEQPPTSAGPQTRSSRRVRTSSQSTVKPKPTPISVSRRKANMTDNLANGGDDEEAVESDHEVQSPLLEKQHNHRGSTASTTATADFAPRRSARHKKSPSVVHELRDGTKYVDDETSTPAKRGGSVVHELRDGVRYIDE